MFEERGNVVMLVTYSKPFKQRFGSPLIIMFFLGPQMWPVELIVDAITSLGNKKFYVQRKFPFS